VLVFRDFSPETASVVIPSDPFGVLVFRDFSPETASVVIPSDSSVN